MKRIWKRLWNLAALTLATYQLFGKNRGLMFSNEPKKIEFTAADEAEIFAKSKASLDERDREIVQ